MSTSGSSSSPSFTVKVKVKTAVVGRSKGRVDPMPSADLTFDALDRTVSPIVPANEDGFSLPFACVYGVPTLMIACPLCGRVTTAHSFARHRCAPGEVHPDPEIGNSYPDLSLFNNAYKNYANSSLGRKPRARDIRNRLKKAPAPMSAPTTQTNNQDDENDDDDDDSGGNHDDENDNDDYIDEGDNDIDEDEMDGYL